MTPMRPQANSFGTSTPRPWRRASRDAGHALAWTEAEVVALDKAAQSADRGAQVSALLDGEMAPAQGPRASLSRNSTNPPCSTRLTDRTVCGASIPARAWPSPSAMRDRAAALGVARDGPRQGASRIAPRRTRAGRPRTCIAACSSTSRTALEHRSSLPWSAEQPSLRRSPDRLAALLAGGTVRRCAISAAAWAPDRRPLNHCHDRARGQC